MGKGPSDPTYLRSLEGLVQRSPQRAQSQPSHCFSPKQLQVSEVLHTWRAQESLAPAAEAGHLQLYVLIATQDKAVPRLSLAACEKPTEPHTQARYRVFRKQSQAEPLWHRLSPPPAGITITLKYRLWEQNPVVVSTVGGHGGFRLCWVLLCTLRTGSSTFLTSHRRRREAGHRAVNSSVLMGALIQVRPSQCSCLWGLLLGVTGCVPQALGTLGHSRATAERHTSALWNQQEALGQFKPSWSSVHYHLSRAGKE